MKTRITSTNSSDRRKGKSYNKLITSIDKTQANGYSLIGEFLSIGKEYDVEVGSIILKVGNWGSWKNGYQSGIVCQVSENGNLDEIESYDYYKEFLSMRDKIEELLNAEKQITTFSSEKFIENLTQLEKNTLKNYLNTL
jgi:hypothetical protein